MTAERRIEAENLDQKIAEILQNQEVLSENSRIFMRNVYKEGLGKYIKRLKSLGFEGKEHVLDAGCGFGQWSMALSTLTKNVSGCDVDEERIKTVRTLADNLQIKNVDFRAAPSEKLPYETASFDGAISYSVLYLTDYVRSIKELARVLRPGGLLYISTNDIGVFLREFVLCPHKKSDFNSRTYAINSFRNMLLRRRENLSLSNGAHPTRLGPMLKLLKQEGFRVVETAPEGHLAGQSNPFVRSHFCGIRSSYDLLAVKN